MSMKSENEIVGGTVLRIPAIQSPNFVHLTSGWIIRGDGSAEFMNLFIVGGTFIGGTLQGSVIQLSGAASGEFIYSGTPAAGNLVGAWTPSAGTDAFGNTYPAGLSVVGPTGSAIRIEPLNPNATIIFSANGSTSDAYMNGTPDVGGVTGLGMNSGQYLASDATTLLRDRLFLTGNQANGAQLANVDTTTQAVKGGCLILRDGVAELEYFDLTGTRKNRLAMTTSGTTLDPGVDGFEVLNDVKVDGALRGGIQVLSANASSTLTLTNALQDVPGATITFTTRNNLANVVVRAVFDSSVTTISGTTAVSGQCVVDGVVQSAASIWLPTAANQRGTVGQQWLVQLGAAGSHTIKLGALKTSAAGVYQVMSTHTSIVIEVFEQ